MMGRITMIIRHKSRFLLIRLKRHACYFGGVWCGGGVPPSHGYSRALPACDGEDANATPLLQDTIIFAKLPIA